VMPVSADTKPVAICDRAAFAGLQRLPDKGIFRLE
jgi:hypothetical protein